MKVKGLHSVFVGEVEDIDLRRTLDQSVIDGITDAMDRYAVLVFRGQTLSDDQQLAFSQRFGELEVTVSRSTRVSSPKISDVSNLDSANQRLDAGDARRIYGLGNLLWHTDSSFKTVPATYSMLSARVTTSKGGQTEFTDLRAAYDSLPEDLKIRLEGLSAEHSLAYSRALIGFDLVPGMQSPLVPAIHPVVQVHPGSKRKTLFLASHASHIVGLPVPDGRLLLMQLMELATRRELVYQHNWRVGDLVIWDNRCTMHRGLSYDHAEIRDLRRTTVSSGIAG